MNRNSYWLGYILLLFVVVASYTGFAFFKIYRYSRLSGETLPQTVHWVSDKRAEDDFVLVSDYTFNWEGKSYQGHMDDSEHYLNDWASQEALNKLNQRTFQVWFDPSNPGFSTLTKSFPIKYSIYAGLLWLLFFYFIWLGNSVKNRL